MNGYQKCGFVCCVWLIWAGATVHALPPGAEDVPAMISYQGLVTVDDVPFDGTGYFKFALLPSPDASTGRWGNDYLVPALDVIKPTSAVELSVENGLFMVELGNADLPNMVPLPSYVFWPTRLYLRIWFSDDNQSFTQLEPDQPLSSVPYAAVAGGVVYNSITADNIQNNSITSNKLNWATMPSMTISGFAQSGPFETAPVASGTNSIAFGDQNVASGNESTVSGGIQNQALGDNAFVGGGRLNTASNAVPSLAGATVVGGYLNTAGNSGAFVGGGYHNRALGDRSFVGGGNGNEASGDVSFVGGGKWNKAISSSAFVGGGESNWASNSWASVAGGRQNRAGGQYATVGGGYQNRAPGANAVIGGGYQNQANTNDATVAGGRLNEASGGIGATVSGGWNNQAISMFATVGGGAENRAGAVSGGSYSTVPGGFQNVAAGNYSFAAGRQAKAALDGQFVWADSTGTDLTSPMPNTVTFRASGGYRLISDDKNSLGVELLANATAWSILSDREVKENFEDIDPREILEQVAALPLAAWNYKADPGQRRYIGPVAQDFHSAFGLGNETTINTLDTDGVALAAIQGLNAKVDELEAENLELKQRLERLEALLLSLDAAK